MFHLWLPKAHVEAPLGGSMMLAGVLLKMGRFGLFRVIRALIIKNGVILDIIFRLAIRGVVFSALICLVQSDIKSMVAYSSVRHINLATGALMRDRYNGWSFRVICLLSHGLVSPCLFVLAYCCYKRVGSRSIAVCRGFLKTSPALSLMWFVFCVSNFGCPPCLEFFGEVGILISFFYYCGVVLGIGSIGVYLVAAYRIYLYSVVNHGGVSRLNKPQTSTLNRRVMCCLYSRSLMVFVCVIRGDWLCCGNFGLLF